MSKTRVSKRPFLNPNKCKHVFRKITNGGFMTPFGYMKLESGVCSVCKKLIVGKLSTKDAGRV